MEELATNVNSGQKYAGVYFLLTRNLTGDDDVITTIIGNSSYFGGIFDGDGHKIKVNISATGLYAGVFGYISGATIKNLSIAGSVNGICYAGGVCGYAESSTIVNCYNVGYISATRLNPSYSGGICGMATSTTTTISNCYNTGNISSSYTGSCSGGICAIGGKIQNCFVSNCQITNTNDAPLSKIGRIGGYLEGYYGGNCTNCYADISVSVNGNPIGSQDENSKNGKDISIANFKSPAWLQSTLGWNLSTIWGIVGQYPEFQAQYSGYQNATIVLNLPEISYGDQITLDISSTNTTTSILVTSSDNSVAEITGNLFVAKKAGNVTITAFQPSGSAFFVGEKSINVTIKKKELKITANPASATYGDAMPSYSCQYSGFISGDNESALTKLPRLTCSATSLSNAGQYTITPSGAEAANYTFTYINSILTIGKRNLQVIPNNASRIYSYPNPALSLSYIGFVNGDNDSQIATKPSVTTAATLASNAGEYPITCSGGIATNYSFVYETGTLTITKAPLTVNTGNASRAYGTANPAFTINYSGFRNGEAQTALTVLPQATCMATSASDAGYYPVVVSGGEAINYDFVYIDGSLTINKALLTVTAQSISSVYGDAHPFNTYTCQYTGFVNNETKNVLTKLPTLTCSATAQSDVGDYAIVPSGAEATNYTFTYINGMLTITKAPLTITAEDKQRKQGEDNPPFTLSYSGFKNNENESVLDVLPNIYCSANINSAGGFYDIVLSGGSDNNYSYRLINGKLEVTFPTGLAEISTSNISVYPNPAKDYVYIKSDTPVKKVEIYSQSGACVLINDNPMEKVSVAGLANGVYLVRIYTNGTSVTKKMVVKK